MGEGEGKKEKKQKNINSIGVEWKMGHLWLCMFESMFLCMFVCVYACSVCVNDNTAFSIFRDIRAIHWIDYNRHNYNGNHMSKISNRQ